MCLKPIITFWLTCWQQKVRTFTFIFEGDRWHYTEIKSLSRLLAIKNSKHVEFYDGQNQFKVPFMMYADFEALLELIQERVSGDPNEPYTSEVSRHIPSG